MTLEFIIKYIIFMSPLFKWYVKFMINASKNGDK